MRPDIDGVLNAVNQFRQNLTDNPEAQKKRVDFYENKLRQPALQNVQKLPIGGLGRSTAGAITNYMLPETLPDNKPFDEAAQREFAMNVAMDMVPGVVGSTRAVGLAKKGLRDAPEFLKMVDNYDDLSSNVQTQAYIAAREFAKTRGGGSKELRDLAVKNPRKWLNTIADFVRGDLEESVERVGDIKKISPTQPKK